MLGKVCSIILLVVAAHLIARVQSDDDNCGGFADASDSINQDILEKTNIKRQNNSATPVVLNDTLIAQAQKWAETLASTGNFDHSHTPGVGENLYAICCGNSPDDGDNGAVQSWYNEAPCYTGEGEGDFNSYGHFTQLVWESTTDIGCGACQDAQNNWTYYVCQYYPPGNVQGQYEENVFEPYGEETGQECAVDSTGGDQSGPDGGEDD